MIFVHFSAIIYCFHGYFATWSKYFATWDLFRGSGALPSDVYLTKTPATKLSTNGVDPPYLVPWLVQRGLKPITIIF